MGALPRPEGPELRRIPISDDLRQPTLLVADPCGGDKPAYVKGLIRHLYQSYRSSAPRASPCSSQGGATT